MINSGGDPCVGRVRLAGGPVYLERIKQRSR